MTLVRDPVARAEGAKTKLQAARLYQQLDAELALNDDLSPEWEADAEQALSILKGRYEESELEDATVAAGTTRDGFIPSISSGAKRGLGAPHGGRRRAGAAKRTTTAQGSSSPKPAGKAGKRSTSTRRSSRRRVGGRALARTGLPGAADSATGMLLWLAGVTVGLTLIYVLVRGNGPRAVQIASGSLTTGLRAFLAPTDPLRPAAKAAPGKPAGPAPGNAYERGVQAGELAGPPAPGLAPRLIKPTTHTKVIPR